MFTSLPMNRYSRPWRAANDDAKVENASTKPASVSVRNGGGYSESTVALIRSRFTAVGPPATSGAITQSTYSGLATACAHDWYQYRISAPWLRASANADGIRSRFSSGDVGAMPSSAPP